MPVLHMRQESQPPQVLHLSLVSGPINQQCPMQCALMFPEKISTSRCAEFLSTYALPAPLPPACGLGLGKGEGPGSQLIMTLPFYLYLSALLFFTRCRLSVL